jgi:hypothetical protein
MTNLTPKLSREDVQQLHKQGYTHAQIAEMTGWSQTQVFRFVHDAPEVAKPETNELAARVRKWMGTNGKYEEWRTGTGCSQRPTYHVRFRHMDGAEVSTSSTIHEKAIAQVWEEYQEIRVARMNKNIKKQQGEK